MGSCFSCAEDEKEEKIDIVKAQGTRIYWN